MKAYKIEEDKKTSYAARKAGKMALLLTGGVLALLLVLMLSMDNGFKVLEIVQWHWFLIIVVGVFGLRFVQELNLATALVFIVKEDKIIKGYETKKLNEGNKYGISKQERRYGATSRQEINISDIRNVEISDKKVKIQSKDYNFFNGNGMIEIPAEVNQYEQLKRQLESLRVRDMQ
ncbi:MAG: hypothetical protein AB8H47_31590 [Bacteroidia bacterium]